MKQTMALYTVELKGPNWVLLPWIQFSLFKKEKKKKNEIVYSKSKRIIIWAYDVAENRRRFLLFSNFCE